MRFLVDECCDTELIAGLREDGHDVLAVEEYRRSEVDEEVLPIAFDEERILVTEDRDFGELVFRFQLPARGVVYLRFPVTKGDQKLPRMRDLLRDATERLPGAFVVVEPERIRFRPLT